MIDYIETHITDHCNLHCKGCSHFSGLAMARNKNIDQFRREMFRLADIDDIRTIRLMGGEPLLNPEFMEYCRIARHIFPNSNVVLVTNGLLAHRLKPYVDELNNLNIEVTMSNYHIEEQETGFLYNLKKWSVHEKGNLYNISLDLKGGNNSQQMFDGCDLHQNKWYFFQDGRMYPCCIAGNISTFQNHFIQVYLPVAQSECGIDIFTHSREEIIEFLNQPCKLCEYCRTDLRGKSYHPFAKSERKLTEWTITT